MGPPKANWKARRRIRRPGAVTQYPCPKQVGREKLEFVGMEDHDPPITHIFSRRNQPTSHCAVCKRMFGSLEIGAVHDMSLFVSEHFMGFLIRGFQFPLPVLPTISNPSIAIRCHKPEPNYWWNQTLEISHCPWSLSSTLLSEPLLLFIDKNNS